MNVNKKGRFRLPAGRIPPLSKHIGIVYTTL